MLLTYLSESIFVIPVCLGNSQLNLEGLLHCYSIEIHPVSRSSMHAVPLLTPPYCDFLIKTPLLHMLYYINWLTHDFWTRTGGWEFDRSHGAGTSSPSHWQQVEEQAPKPVGWTTGQSPAKWIWKQILFSLPALTPSYIHIKEWNGSSDNRYIYLIRPCCAQVTNIKNACTHCNSYLITYQLNSPHWHLFQRQYLTL